MRHAGDKREDTTTQGEDGEGAQGPKAEEREQEGACGWMVWRPMDSLISKPHWDTPHSIGKDLSRTSAAPLVTPLKDHKAT